MTLFLIGKPQVRKITYGFEIERSTNGQDWENIGFVAGNGTTNEISDYEFTDDLNRVGFQNRHGLYYRLKQIDLPAGQAGFDGKYEYSNIIQLVTGNSQLATRFFPNPTTDILNIACPQLDCGTLSQPTLIQIFNTNGQMVKEQSIQNSQIISVKDLPSGIYHIKIGQNFQKLMIQR